MKYLKLFLFILLIGAIGAVFGVLLGQSALIKTLIPDKTLFSPGLIILLCFVPFFVLGIHELGHLLTGLAQGNRFELFVVGPLGVKRTEKNKIRPYLNTNLGQFGGLAASSPRNFGLEAADKMAMVILAGPLASLGLSLTCFLLMLFMDQPQKFILFFTGLISFFILLATLLPSKSGMFYTDRKRYQRLKSHGKEKEIELALMKANTLKVLDKPIQGMDEAELRLITEDESTAFRYIGYYYLFEYFQNNLEKQESIEKEMQSLNAELPKTFVKMMSREIDKLRIET